MPRETPLRNPLQNEDRVVGWIAELTHEPADTVRRRLREEYEQPGTNVIRGLQETGIERYVWSDAMARFYEQTDAFLYELVIWNLNGLKEAMRRAVARQLAKGRTGPQDLLTVGDGLGLDSARWAAAGHRVTYFELPGHAERFARKLFAEAGVDVKVLTNPDRIRSEGYDALVCLDVLEHVPDPPDFVGTLASYLRPGGRLIVHAPFLMVHPTTPTHLKANRRYSASLSLYAQHHLRLVDGEPAWCPITLQKAGGSLSPPSGLAPRLLMLRLTGCIMAIGRRSFLPFSWINAYRQRHRHWFDEPHIEPSRHAQSHKPPARSEA
jgi:SAM-dependent methyltransferase